MSPYMSRAERAKRSAQRAQEMKLLREKGWTLKQIGKEYGLSYERVRQILYKHRAKGKP